MVYTPQCSQISHPTHTLPPSVGFPFFIAPLQKTFKETTPNPSFYLVLLRVKNWFSSFPISYFSISVPMSPASLYPSESLGPSVFLYRCNIDHREMEMLPALHLFPANLMTFLPKLAETFFYLGLGWYGKAIWKESLPFSWCQIHDGV